MFWEIYKMGFKHIGIALTVMLGFTRYTSVYFNILYHFFMSEVSQFKNVKICEGIK